MKINVRYQRKPKNIEKKTQLNDLLFQFSKCNPKINKNQDNVIKLDL